MAPKKEPQSASDHIDGQEEHNSTKQEQSKSNGATDNNDVQPEETKTEAAGTKRKADESAAANEDHEPGTKAAKVGDSDAMDAETSKNGHKRSSNGDSGAKDEDDSKNHAATNGNGKVDGDGGGKSTAAKGSDTVVKMIRYLLSSDGESICRPKDEEDAMAEYSKAHDNSPMRTYSTSIFSPFEELLCALILSRPIGHMLGVRSIRTLFNKPHELNTPAAILKAGYEGCRQALDEARTQHRQKTAEEMVLLAETLRDHLGSSEDDMEMTKLRKDAAGDAPAQRNILQKQVKGMAKTGIDIFARRIQAVWPEWYPFADDRTLNAIKTLGLGDSVEALVENIDRSWSELEGSLKSNPAYGKSQSNDADSQKRRVFVITLERAVGADLEGKLDDILAQV